MAEDNKRAYNALLTLLKDDTSSKPKKAKVAKQNSLSEKRPSTEEAVEAVEGAGSESEQEDDEPEIQIEDDNEGDRKDPFESHFAAPPAFDPPNDWKLKHVTTLSILGERSVVQVPGNRSQFSGTEEFKLAPLSTKEALKKVKHRLQAPFFRNNHHTEDNKLSPLQSQLAAPLFNYLDVMVTQRTWENCDQYLDLTVLHLVNHIYKTRDRVLKNNTKIKEAQKRLIELKNRERRNFQASIDDEQNEEEVKEAGKEVEQNNTSNENEKTEDEDETDKEYRDQGFTRPKVLVLLPTRNSAYDFVNRMTKISGLNQAENKKRFKEAFYLDDSGLENKPEDFQKLFAGNTNEVFCLGVKFTRQAFKLYSSFYASDLIIASPLGLRLIVDKKDYDFLSSIEITVCDQLDAIAMQSWTNVKHIFSKLNLIPKNPHDCDFSRVRECYLDEKSKYLRQTILLGAYAVPEMVALFNKSCLNIAGKLRTRVEYPGIISNLRIHIRQIFTRVGVSDFTQDSKQRLNHFTSSLLPSLMRGAQTEGILLVAPNYMDFVLLRNYLEKNDYSYVSLSEYTAPPQLGRGRTFFADGRAKMMLYSARLHHYRRYGIKGTRTVVFYGLPDNPVFYKEFVHSLARTVIEQQVDPDLLKVHVLFSKWDSLKLERVVGTKRMAALVEGNSDTHEFY